MQVFTTEPKAAWLRRSGTTFAMAFLIVWAQGVARAQEPSHITPIPRWALRDTTPRQACRTWTR